MDVVYSLKPLAALIMTPHHHSGSPTPQFFKIWPPAGVFNGIIDLYIRSAKKDDNYGASNIVPPCPIS
jgi:hypothetical protein